MDIKQFNYELPRELIAQFPLDPRDSSKLLVLDRESGSISHHIFSQLPTLLRADDVLIFNQTRVFPARLLGHKATGGKAELLLLQQQSNNTWKAIGRPAIKTGQTICFDRQLSATVVDISSDGEVLVEFSIGGRNLINLIEQIGHTPLPPYIHSRSSESRLRRQYQTVYAKKFGSSAAPTAGLHFTPELQNKLDLLGVTQEYVTLHVGLGTFKPVGEEQFKNNKLHTEPYEIDDDTLSRLLDAKKSGRRLIAVGTTTARVLESYAKSKIQSGNTDIFIHPPYQFQLVDGLITNFHLPQSSLIMLISAFVSAPNTSHQFTDFLSTTAGKAYLQAISEQYRFFSFGDAMFIS